jgi:SAM-dependent methyltransferase
MTSMDVLAGQLWVLGTIGRLAEQGLLEKPAPSGDLASIAGQRLLVEAGWLTAEPFGPTDRLRSALPPNVPLTAASGYVRELLAQVTRYARGAEPGWQETDPDLIRWRGGSSGQLVGAILTRSFSQLPGFPERLNGEGAAVLDVGTGASGVAIELCRRFPGLLVTGLDTSATAVMVAEEEVANAGLARQIEVRATSVADLADEAAFDLVWVPQMFIPEDTLRTALPRLYRATRPGGALVMALAAHELEGTAARAADLTNLMTGGGTADPARLTAQLTDAGFTRVQLAPPPFATVLLAERH